MSDLTDALTAKGFTTTRFFLASGPLEGTGRLDPSAHAYTQGKAQDTAAYRERYGMPNDGQLYHPQSKVENRLLVVRAAEEARQAGFFKAQLGLDLPEVFDGENLSHIEMCDDIDFCFPSALWATFWSTYGPAAEPVTVAPPPPHPQPFDPGIPADMQRVAHEHPELIFRSRVYLEPGLGTPEAWDALFASRGLPALSVYCAAPGFNPLDPNGPAVAVEASHFLEIWAAYKGAPAAIATAPAAPASTPEPAPIDGDVVAATLEEKKDAILAAIEPGVDALIHKLRAASPALAALEVKDAHALLSGAFDLFLGQVTPALAS